MGVSAAGASDLVLEPEAVEFLSTYGSASTRDGYRRDLLAFARFRRGLNLFEVRRRDIERYMRELEARNRQPATRARHLAAIRQLFRYLQQEHGLEVNPAEFVQPPAKTRKPKARGVDTGELQRFLASADEEPNLRDRALCYLLAWTGARISEAVSLQVESLSLEGGHNTVEFLGKGEKHRRSVVPHEAWDLLIETCAERTTGPLFPSRTGGCISRSLGAKIVKRVGNRAGLNRRRRPVTPHSLRRGFVTESLKAGVALHHIQDAVGHADPRTTRMYDVAEQDLANAPAYAVVDRLNRHPRA